MSISVYSMLILNYHNESRSTALIIKTLRKYHPFLFHLPFLLSFLFLSSTETNALY